MPVPLVAPGRRGQRIPTRSYLIAPNARPSRWLLNGPGLRLSHAGLAHCSLTKLQKREREKKIRQQRKGDTSRDGLEWGEGLRTIIPRQGLLNGTGIILLLTFQPAVTMRLYLARRPTPGFKGKYLLCSLWGKVCCAQTKLCSKPGKAEKGTNTQLCLAWTSLFL